MPTHGANHSEHKFYQWNQIDIIVDYVDIHTLLSLHNLHFNQPLMINWEHQISQHFSDIYSTIYVYTSQYCKTMNSG